MGSELELFAAVRNWKSYWSGAIKPYIVGDVAEVGAGIGSNHSFLQTGKTNWWVCLEPDFKLVARLMQNVEEPEETKKTEVIPGKLADLDGRNRFDTTLYIDVLEHIEDDRGELELAASHLKEGGRVIVLFRHIKASSHPPDRPVNFGSLGFSELERDSALFPNSASSRCGG